MRGKAAGSSGDYSTAGDHPRVCGEKIWLSSVCVHASGSPPRMRGKVPGLLLQHLTHGITPAYAGKSTAHVRISAMNGDHPRVCGEKVLGGNLLPVNKGSPPRMRGKETPSLVVVRGSRITPAYAGKSLPEELEQALPKDHPRVCGEKACMQCTLQGHGGSPPRMRGKGRRNGRAFPGNGITPAYAGKSGHAINPNVCGQDHPRVCGEKSPFSLFRPPHLGSPPRMRGKVYSRTCSIVLDGITPAYAGKSFLMFLRSGLLRDHPRVCGEKGSRIFQDPAGMGSPPRMRGKGCCGSSGT